MLLALVMELKKQSLGLDKFLKSLGNMKPFLEDLCGLLANERWVKDGGRVFVYDIWLADCFSRSCRSEGDAEGCSSRVVTLMPAPRSAHVAPLPKVLKRYEALAEKEGFPCTKIWMKVETGSKTKRMTLPQFSRQGQGCL